MNVEKAPLALGAKTSSKKGPLDRDESEEDDGGGVRDVGLSMRGESSP